MKIAYNKKQLMMLKYQLIQEESCITGINIIFYRKIVLKERLKNPIPLDDFQEMELVNKVMRKLLKIV